jgi:hypothetical protein
MNVARTEPIKDAYLPCTAQSIPSRENEDVCDVLHSDDLSNERMKDVDNFIPELGSLLQNFEDETLTVSSGNISSVGSDLMELNDELLTDSDLNKLKTALSAFSDLKTLNSGLSIDSFAPQVEEKTGINVISEVQPKVLLPDVEENKDHIFVKNELLTDSDLKTLNSGLSIDSFAPQVEEETVINVISEIQPKVLLPDVEEDVEENKDHIFVKTESCQSGSTDASTKWSETSSYLEDTMDRYVTVCIENQNQELALTLLCVTSEHSGSTAVRPPFLNTSTSPAAKTTHCLNISQRAGDSETVGQLSHTEILHSMTNSNKTAVEESTDIMTSEVDMSGVTPYLIRDIQEHTYFKVKDEHFISASQEEPFEFPTHDETSHSFSFVDNTVTGKSVGDIAIEVSVPGLTAYAMSEVLANSERSNGPEITIVSEASSKKPRSSESVAAATQKRAKDGMTASQAEQNNCTKIPDLPPGLFFQKKGSKLCNNQQNKLIIKETNIDKTCSSLKSQISFAPNKREKFPGFTFEKPVVPQQVTGRCQIKNNRSKTERASKSTKKC